MKTLNSVREIFAHKLKTEDYTLTGKSGKMLEELGFTFCADEDTIFGKINYEYAAAELEWFKSMSRNVDDLFEIWGKSVQIWDMISDENRLVHSNYGHLAMHPDNGSQMDRVLEKLKKDRTSRQGTAVYNRPSIHDDWNKDGMSDFICTMGVHYNIRNALPLSLIHISEPTRLRRSRMPSSA